MNLYLQTEINRVYELIDTNENNKQQINNYILMKPA